MLNACELKRFLVACNVFFGSFLGNLNMIAKALLFYTVSDKRLLYVICGDIKINLLQH